MQDIILGRMWADHHQRIYGDAGHAQDHSASPAERRAADPLPPVGKAIMLALAVSVASIGASVTLA